MTLCVRTNPVEERQPDVAERGVFRQDDVLAETDVRAPPCEKRGTVVEEMDGTDVAAVAEYDVIEQAGRRVILGGFEFVDERRQHLALNGVPALRELHPIALRPLVVAEVVSGVGDADVLEHRVDGLAKGEDPRCVGAHRCDHQIVHGLDFVPSGQSLAGLSEGGWSLRDLEPLPLLGKSHFDVSDALRVFLGFVPILVTETELEPLDVSAQQVQNASFLVQHRDAFGQ